jgi:pimeloyl-ACP methyl ester carboxylesterase
MLPKARRLASISYDEMLELASLGAGVMHSRSIEFAKKFGVKVLVRSSFKDMPGTVILAAEQSTPRPASGVALAKDEARITLENVPDQPGSSHALFSKLAASGIELPAAYAAKVRVLENFSPKTINDASAIGEWFEMFTAFPLKRTPGWRAQMTVVPRENRLLAYRSISTEVLVIGFADDVITPPALGREVGEALPNGRYIQIANAGHLGFLERPDPVNNAMLQFFAGTLI